MQEHIHCFGQHQNLHGIYTEADQSNQLPTVLIINAGAVHKAGPFNLHVQLARHLASIGVNSFRFDLSGQGDSLKVASPLSREDQILSDMHQALDFLQNHYQQERFVSFGLCTGAENAHKIAVHDPRVKGLVWIDGYGYLTPKFKRVKLLKKLLNPTGIIKTIIKRLLPKKKTRPEKPIQEGLNTADSFVWRLPDRDSYVEDMMTLNSRNTRCLYIYSGGVQSYYNYLGQMKDAFSDTAFLPLIEEAYFPRADHTFFILNDKQALFTKISGWLNIIFSEKV